MHGEEPVQVMDTIGNTNVRLRGCACSRLRTAVSYVAKRGV